MYVENADKNGQNGNFLTSRREKEQRIEILTKRRIT